MIIDTAITAAIAAGEAIMEIYGQDFEVEFKADESPLTTADKASHEIITKALEATPYPILSEESDDISYDERKDWKTYWLVDPLDGTKEFIKKNDEFTVNIALITNHQPVMGVVYVPAQDIIYYGGVAEGMEHGAWRTENCLGKSVEEIRATATPCTKHPAGTATDNSLSRIKTEGNGSPPCTTPLRVVASKSHCNEETNEFITALETECGAVERVSRGSSLKLCMVAEGSADIYPRIAPTMEWDTAAAHAVVVASGGQVVEYDPSVMAPEYLHGSNKMQNTDSTSPVVNNLTYNKENLLNPYFVVSGLRK